MPLTGVDQTFKNAFDHTMWKKRANGGGEEKEYSNLNWVKNPDLLAFIPAFLGLKGDEIVLDMATGSGVVAKEIAPHVSRVIASDISFSMLGLVKDKPENVSLSAMDFTKPLPFPNESVDIITARMVFHHLSNQNMKTAVSESLRVLRPNGKLLVVEYVSPTNNSRDFEQAVFDIKERGRHLWTPQSLFEVLQALTDKSEFSTEIQSKQAIMKAYSVKDWVGKSGLSTDEQQLIENIYFTAPPEVVEDMNIRYVTDDQHQKTDSLIDRVFTHVALTKLEKK